MRVPHFGAQLVRAEPAAQRARDEMLDQHVLRAHDRRARLDAPRGRGAARGGGLDELERLHRHDGDARDLAGPVAAAARALQQAADALGAADLQHLVDRREVDAEVEARRADHRAQAAVAQARLDPVAHVALERTVVQRDRAGPVGTRFEQRLVPDFGLRTDVGEHQRGSRALDRADDLRQHLEADVTGPGETVDRGRQRADDLDRLGVETFHDPGPRGRRAHARRPHEACERLVEVRERGGESPDRQAGLEAAQPRERQFRLHAAFRRHEFVPFVADDGRHVREPLAPVGARQHQREALRRRHQRRRQALRLLRAHRRRRVAGADVDRPVRIERARGLREREAGVARERAQRGQPEQRRRRRMQLGAAGPERDGPERRRIGLAHAGRRVDEAAVAGRVCRPHLFLERERLESLRGEPVAHRPERVEFGNGPGGGHLRIVRSACRPVCRVGSRMQPCSSPEGSALTAGTSVAGTAVRCHSGKRTPSPGRASARWYSRDDCRPGDCCQGPGIRSASQEGPAAEAWGRPSRPPGSGHCTGCVSGILGIPMLEYPAGMVDNARDLWRTMRHAYDEANPGMSRNATLR